MKTELRPTKFGTLASTWEEMAPGASVDFRLRRKRHGFAGICEEIGPGMIRGRLATKRDAVQLRRSWEPPRVLKAPFDPGALQARPWVARMIVLLRAEIAEQIKPQPVATEVFRGRVDDVVDGIAVVTLFSEAGEAITAQWPEQDLASESIEKGDLFDLTMTDTGGKVTFSFRKVTRKPIPDDLWREIERVKAAYSDLKTDGGDGGEES